MGLLEGSGFVKMFQQEGRGEERRGEERRSETHFKINHTLSFIK